MERFNIFCIFLFIGNYSVFQIFIMQLLHM